MKAQYDTGVTLKNIAVAPDGIVKKVYPIQGNEALLGFTFMDRARPGNAEAIAAYNQGKMVVTEPFELVQGGKGMAGRLPVFLSQNGNESFWGLVTVTMDFDELMESIHLEALSDMGANYRLWYRGNDGKPVVLEQSSVLPENPVSYEVSLRNITWCLDVAPMKGWVDKVEVGIGFAIIVSLSLLMALVISGQERVRQANEQLRRMAHLDGLTSCYSRHYVNSILINQRTGRWSDPNAKYSIAMLDIDHFKEVNDQYGHELGDRAIIAVSQVTSDYIKQADGDCIIRYGGDEFIVLFNNVTRQRFMDKLEGIVKDTREIRFPDYPDLHLTVSVGGEYYTNPEQSLYHDMVRRADEKLYRSKKNGRDQVTV